MKTPKRNTGNPRAVDLYAQRHSRWKRKNRIAQLKRTIARQKWEYDRLWKGFSHMSSSCVNLYNMYVYNPPIDPNPADHPHDQFYVQLELFSELLQLEEHLKPEFSVSVIRFRQKNRMKFRVWRDDPVFGHFVAIKYSKEIKTETITTPKQIAAEVNRIWSEIPAECKKENLPI